VAQRSLHNQTPIVLGDIVQIDESLFRHKPKAEETCDMLKASKLLLQHHCGRPPQQQIWVFGMVDASVSPGLGYMEVMTT
jgi:hypothetical protein